MTLTFYTITDAPNVINKNIGNGTSIQNCNPVEPCDMLNPSFIMEQGTAAASANYVYVPVFSRYYFITGRTLLSGHRLMITCAVDVLYTYASNIKACTGTVLRSESIGKPSMIPDSKLPIQSNNLIIDADNFPSTPFDPITATYPFILTTIGGTAS